MPKLGRERRKPLMMIMVINVAPYKDATVVIAHGSAAKIKLE